MAAWRRPEDYKGAGIQYKLIDAIDEPTYAMLDHHLEECLDFIRSVNQSERGKHHEGEGNIMRAGKCVVHCQAGSNRSGVIVASEHMLRTRTNVLETVFHCRNCRGNGFLTNPGFQGQLVALARRERLLGPTPGSSNCVVEPWLWRKIQKEMAY